MNENSATYAQREADRLAESYDPAINDYDLSKDPRCLWGWGSPVCDCYFGHACFRALGHPGKCASGPRDDMPCSRRQRPKDWDTKGRAEATTSER